MQKHHRHPGVAALACLLVAASCPALAAPGGGPVAYELDDSHFHLTNYVQEGLDIHRFLEIMGDKVGRVALFGIPLQQAWLYENSGDFAPTYYLETDAPLYYYSFTDAVIATAYRSLAPAEQARFDPMITGFNPADMYAVDHIRRVLRTFPGVFSGIGEFTIHKEFVSGKIAGGPPSLRDPAIDRIFDFAGEAGLLVLVHNDVDIPFAKTGAEPAYLTQMQALLRRHPRTTVIWAHCGLGRVVHPLASQQPDVAGERSPGQVGVLEAMLKDPAFAHVYFDISWDELGKYIVGSPATLRLAADVINRYPDRFLFGTDAVAPTDQQKYLKVYYQYEPLWNLLSPAAREQVKMGNYERLFDAARVKVRAWEKAHLAKG